MPARPWVRPVHSSSAVLPMAVGAARPATNTRRAYTTRSLLRVVRDVLEGVADRDDLLGVLVGNLDVEVLLERHHQLDGVERVRAQVPDELRGRRHALLFDAQRL